MKCVLRIIYIANKKKKLNVFCLVSTEICALATNRNTENNNKLLDYQSQAINMQNLTFIAQNYQHHIELYFPICFTSFN